jgi:putative ABC transport system permease protein
MLVHTLVPDVDAGSGVYREGVWSYPKYATFLELQRSFDDTSLFASREFSLSGDGSPERVRGEVVTERYPAVLGVAPAIGRPFTYDEAHRTGAPAVVSIGHGLWTRRYGADPAILGRTIQVNATPYTVVGVLPRGFRGLTGDAEIWTPVAALEAGMLTQRENHSYTIVARRKADVSEQAAITAVRMHGRQIELQYTQPAEKTWTIGAAAASLYASRVDGDIRRASFVLLGAVGFVLLIASVNLTNLLIARAIGRRREVAIRVAVGAGRGRIARQFTVETLVLAAFGAAGGLLVASLLLNAAAVLLPDSDVFFRTAMAPGQRRIAGAAGLTRIGASMIGFDAVTLLFTCGVTVLTASVIALAPVLQASSLRPLDVLKTAGGADTGWRRHRLGARGALVTAQIAVALVLLIGAGLMLKSAARLQSTAIGIAPDNVITARIELPAATYSAEGGGSFYAQLVERMRAVPGVESVGLANCAPVSGGCNGTSIWFGGAPRRGSGLDPLVGIHWATPEYFSTLGIRLLRGRMFTDRDRAGQPKVALVTDAAARAFWPNETPIGKRISVGQGGFHDGAEVIGVVADVRYRAIETAPTADVYVPVAQSFQRRMRVFVRSDLDAQSIVTALRREVRALDPNLPLSEIKTMEERLGDAMWRTRVAAWLLSIFAAVALLLTAIGVFGVMAQTVMQRTAEIGVRMALGAQRRDVLALVLGRAAVVTAAGLALGTACALGLTRLLAALLYGIEPTDSATFVSVAMLLALVSLAACYLPARRAAGVNAAAALRSE